MHQTVPGVVMLENNPQILEGLIYLHFTPSPLVHACKDWTEIYLLAATGWFRMLVFNIFRSSNQMLDSRWSVLF